MPSRLLLLTNVFMLLLLQLPKPAYGRYYLDSGEQSVIHDFSDPGDREELEVQILDVLGLQHRPKPHISAAAAAGQPPDLQQQPPSQSPSARFLIELFRSVLDQESGSVRPELRNASSPSTPDARTTEICSNLVDGEPLPPASLAAINEADKIVSIAASNHRLLDHQETEVPSHHRLLFDLRSGLAPSDQVIEAEVRLFRDPRRALTYPPSWNYTVSLHQVIQVSNGT